MKINEIITESQLNERIRKVEGGYRLLSRKGKNLGTFPSKAAAEKHEREVQYFKHANEGVTEGEWDGTGETDMAAAVTAAGNSAEDAETEKAIAMSETSDYFRSEEDRIAGVKPPLKNKKNPANTDHSKRRENEKKANESQLDEFLGFGKRSEAPVAPKASPEEMRKYFARGAGTSGADPQFSTMAAKNGMMAQRVRRIGEDDETPDEKIVSIKTGKTVQPERASMKQAFGSMESNILDKIGVSFTEKPDYWEDLDNAEDKIDQVALQRIKRLLAKNGLRLATYTARDLYGMEPRNPVSRVLNMPEETVFVVELGDGGKYLVDRHGAKSYIRNWAPIAVSVDESPDGVGPSTKMVV